MRASGAQNQGSIPKGLVESLNFVELYRLEDHSTPDCTNLGGLIGPSNASWSLVPLAPWHVLAARRLLALVSVYTPLSCGYGNGNSSDSMSAPART
jgi:hypothetical protein